MCLIVFFYQIGGLYQFLKLVGNVGQLNHHKMLMKDIGIQGFIQSGLLIIVGRDDIREISNMQTVQREAVCIHNFVCQYENIGKLLEGLLLFQSQSLHLIKMCFLLFLQSSREL